jgi:hypothetical protein
LYVLFCLSRKPSCILQAQLLDHRIALESESGRTGMDLPIMGIIFSLLYIDPYINRRLPLTAFKPLSPHVLRHPPSPVQFLQLTPSSSHSHSYTKSITDSPHSSSPSPQYPPSASRTPHDSAPATACL